MSIDIRRHYLTQIHQGPKEDQSACNVRLCSVKVIHYILVKISKIRLAKLHAVYPSPRLQLHGGSIRPNHEDVRSFLIGQPLLGSAQLEQDAAGSFQSLTLPDPIISPGQSPAVCWLPAPAQAGKNP